MRSLSFYKAGRILRNGILSIARNKVLSFATVFIIALIFFVFNLVLALRLATDSVIEKIGEKIDISVEILPTAEDYTVQTLVAKLKERPEIREVIFISKADALKRLGTKYPNIITFLEANQLENPLPHVVRIVSADLKDNNALIAYLQGPQFTQILNQKKLFSNQEQKVRNERILSITQFIKQVGLALNVIFALVVILILFNSINLAIHAQRTEISIMKLVGAKTWFIRGGFLIAGAFYALSALLLSFFFSQLVLRYLGRNLLSVIESESVLLGLNAILFHFEDRLWITLLWQFLAALLLGLLSSYLAIQKYLKTIF